MAGIGDIAKAAGVKYEAVASTIEGIRQLLFAGEKITLQDFGTFYIDVQDKKTARKVATAEEIKVPEKSVPKFRFNYTFKTKIAESVKVDKDKLKKKRERKAKYDAKMAEKAEAGTKAKKK